MSVWLMIQHKGPKKASDQSLIMHRLYLNHIDWLFFPFQHQYQRCCLRLKFGVYLRLSSLL